MKTYSLKSIASLLLISAAGASAQDLSTEVVVDRTFETALPEASPLSNIGPQLLPAPDRRLSLRSAEYGMVSDFKPLVDTSRPPLYTGFPAPDKSKGYVWLGYFPVYNLGVAAGYRFLDKENTKAGAAFNFNGLSYKNRFTDSNVGDNGGRFALYANHSFSNGFRLLFDGNYSFDALKNPSTAPDYDSQTIHNAYVGLRFARIRTDQSLDFGLDYRHFSLAKDLSSVVNGPSENLMRFKADGMFAVAEGIMAGGLFNLDVLGSYDNLTLLGLTPKVSFKGDNYVLDAGLPMNLSFINSGCKFHIAPDVRALWRFDPRASVYASVTGGRRMSTLYNLYRYSPFAPGRRTFAPTSGYLDVRAGVRVGDFEGIRADVFAGYALVNDTPMPIASPTGSYDSMIFATTDIRGWFGGIEVKYSWSTLVDASARFVFGPESMCSTDGAYFDRAKTELRIKADVCPFDDWRFGASYKLRTGRRYGVYGFGDSAVDNVEYNMGTVSDFGLSAKWRYSDCLSFFLNVDNIFNRRPLLLPGLSDRGIHGLLGADFRF